ncbi:tetratricopeptide repeat protein, partial [Leptolyngbya sp. FACHB-36]|uniref:tetratricopeptide repeat protein n=1 Tax=Leptolyngbya sp. FACHB-36 TaxID=2692808 RepID=UPI0016808A11
LKAAPGENESIDVIREAALRDYTQAINLRSNSSVRATALTNRGNVLLARNDLPAAFRDYNQAVQINPNYAAAYYNRGMASQTLNRRDPAITDFRRAADLYQAQGYPRLQTEALNRIKGLQQSQTTAPPPTQSPQTR